MRDGVLMTSGEAGILEAIRRRARLPAGARPGAGHRRRLRRFTARGARGKTCCSLPICCWKTCIFASRRIHRRRWDTRPWRAD